MKKRFPFFKDGRILKKESLWDIRDYAYDSLQLLYMDYTDGILKGCKVQVTEKYLIIGKGLMKYNNFIYILSEEVKVPYSATEQWVALKAVFQEEREKADCMEYEVDFCIDSNIERKGNEFELCRFYLREGSKLRDTYRDFYDMSTEYDTINLIYSSIAGIEGQSLHPEILLTFAQELWNGKKGEIDSNFCLQIWNMAGYISRKVVAAYLSCKEGDTDIQEICTFDNEKLYWNMEEILRTSGGKKQRKDEKKRIIVE